MTGPSGPVERQSKCDYMRSEAVPGRKASHICLESKEIRRAVETGTRLRKTRSLLRRTREVGGRGMLVLLRTFWLLLWYRMALACVPVRRVIGWKQRPPRQAVPCTPEALLRVRHAVLTVARYAPLRFVCFPQCLAASTLLREQGISSRLHYGVARADDKLVTHTWLEAGGEIVIGGEVAGEYSTLAVYAND